MERGKDGLRIAQVFDGAGRFTNERLASINKGLDTFSKKKEPKRGAMLINIAVALLFALALCLWGVSLYAQYQYVMAIKQASLVSWVEAGSLDAGMGIFSLLALGMARAGMSARMARVGVIFCALLSAAMNLAAANSGDLRTVLVYVVPPIFLAMVLDITVAVVRRHYLGKAEASGWVAVGRACLAAVRVIGRVALYALRFVLAPVTTAKGLRRIVLNAAPVPAAPPKVISAKAEPALVAIEAPGTAAAPNAVTAVPAPLALAPVPSGRRPGPRKGTKTDQLIRLAAERNGPLDVLDLSRCSRIATEIAGGISMNASSARTALLKHCRQLQSNATQEASA